MNTGGQASYKIAEKKNLVGARSPRLYSIAEIDLCKQGESISNI